MPVVSDFMKALARSIDRSDASKMAFDLVEQGHFSVTRIVSGELPESALTSNSRSALKPCSLCAWSR